MTNFPNLDAHVRRAWKTKTFSNGLKIKLGATTKEQFFIVKNDGVYEVLASEKGTQVCVSPKGHTTEAYASVPVTALGTYASGHTHPKGPRNFRLEQSPEPEDGRMDKSAHRQGKPSYLIAQSAAYSIEWNGSNYRIKKLVGRGPRQSSLDKIGEEWLDIPPSSRKCTRTPF